MWKCPHLATRHPSCYQGPSHRAKSSDDTEAQLTAWLPVGKQANTDPGTDGGAPTAHLSYLIPETSPHPLFQPGVSPQKRSFPGLTLTTTQSPDPYRDCLVPHNGLLYVLSPFREGPLPPMSAPEPSTLRDSSLAPLLDMLSP